MAILTQSGRVVIAESILLRPIHIAWGRGDAAWITPPPESVDATALMEEVGRRVATGVFVVPDADGEIVAPSGKYAISSAPTKRLYVKTKFTFTDAPGEVIREAAVFVGTTVDPGLPSGQEYFVPADIVDPGRLLEVQNIEPVYRSIATEETFGVILVF